MIVISGLCSIRQSFAWVTQKGWCLFAHQYWCSRKLLGNCFRNKLCWFLPKPNGWKLIFSLFLWSRNEKVCRLSPRLWMNNMFFGGERRERVKPQKSHFFGQSFVMVRGTRSTNKKRVFRNSINFLRSLPKAVDGTEGKSTNFTFSHLSLSRSSSSSS